MPKLEYNTIDDIKNVKQREDLKRLMFERALLGYAFSYEKILAEFGEDGVKRLANCVAARDETNCKKLREDLNEAVLRAFTKHNIDKKIRYEDPFGLPYDYRNQPGTSVTFKWDTAFEWAVAHGIPASKLEQMKEAGTTTKTYTSLVVARVKSGGEE